jgi:uncharacterized protein YdcH (DUF465 family)
VSEISYRTDGENDLDLRASLAKNDPAFKRLLDKHSECEQRLAELGSRRYLTDAEQLDENNLKKQKLALKDQMEELIRTAEG